MCREKNTQEIKLGVDGSILKVIEGKQVLLELPCSLAVQAKWDGCDESTLHRKHSRRDTPRKSRAGCARGERADFALRGPDQARRGRDGRRLQGGRSKAEPTGSA